MRETVVTFGRDTRLVGVIADAAALDAPSGRPAVVLLNAGITHRSGPRRLYVALARALAAEGTTVLRFDFAGIGDSDTPTTYSAPRERCVANTIAAMDYLASTRAPGRFVLVGLCYGAVAAFETAIIDPRVTGIVMLNAQGFLLYAGHVIDEYLARRQNADWCRVVHALAHWGKWKGLMRLDGNTRAVVRTLFERHGKAGNVRRLRQGNPEVTRVVNGWTTLRSRRTGTLVLYSAGDYGMLELEVVLGKHIRRASKEFGLDYHLMRNADHVFTAERNRCAVVDRVVRWIHERTG